MARTLVIADLHLGHRLIAIERGEFDGRVDEHDDWLEAAWREAVRPEDTVYVLGDVAFNRGSLERFGGWPGRKRVALGNHDRFLASEYQAVAKEVRGCFAMRLNARGAAAPQPVLLAHYPVHPWSLRPRFALQIHGHVHGAGGDLGPGYANCAVEAIGPRPVGLHEFAADALARAAEAREPYDVEREALALTAKAMACAAHRDWRRMEREAMLALDEAWRRRW